MSIHGQSFANRAVTDNIAARYPPPDLDRFNIGLLHSAIDGRAGHDPYAPCTIQQLRDHGYHYWALGHVHQREVLSREPWIVFPGNVQGRHINETGPKGATLVTVAGGTVINAVPVHFDVVRWSHIVVALTEDAGEDTALAHVRAALAAALRDADGRLLAARITLSGTCQAHDAFSRDLGAARERIRAEADAIAGPDQIWTEAIEIVTRPVVIGHDRSDAMGQLLRALDGVDDSLITADLQAYATAMLEKANPLRQAIGEDHAATNDASRALLIQRARDLLLGSLCD